MRSVKYNTEQQSTYPRAVVHFVSIPKTCRTSFLLVHCFPQNTKYHLVSIQPLLLDFLTQLPSTCLLGFALHQVSYEVDHGWLKRTSFFQVEALLDGGTDFGFFISLRRGAIVGVLVITNYIDVVARRTRLENRVGVFIWKASANNWDEHLSN
jgi:hypothetical protein